MEISYFEADNDCKFNLAEIFYDEETEFEHYLELESYLIDMGWEFKPISEGYANCIVNGEEEYDKLLDDLRYTIFDMIKITIDVEE